MPADWCPFCPGSGRVPDDYDVLIYPNDFPAFSADAEPFDPTPGLFRSTGARGACDVILYSPNHNLWPSRLTEDQWRKVILLWSRRTTELAALPVVRYVMAFENTGEAIGVTMPHPHGQIYAFPFLPPLVEIELNSAREHFNRTKKCLYCELLDGELRARARIVAENDHFAAFVPFAARFPSEIQLYARRHFGRLGEMTDREIQSLAQMNSIVRRKYDNLYGFLMPLMMVVREAPIQGSHGHFHFHVEFLPIQRSKTKLKYLAAVESSSGTFLADTKAEERAQALRSSEPVT